MPADRTHALPAAIDDPGPSLTAETFAAAYLTWCARSGSPIPSKIIAIRRRRRFAHMKTITQDPVIIQERSVTDCCAVGPTLMCVCGREQEGEA